MRKLWLKKLETKWDRVNISIEEKKGSIRITVRDFEQKKQRTLSENK